jgi:prefoldin subunit 5
LADSIRVTNDETPEMSDADLVALKKAAPLIKEMLIAVDKELYARAEVRTVCKLFLKNLST